MACSGKQTTPDETMLRIWLIFSTGRSLVKDLLHFAEYKN
jgi:hypothetical protein